jgi:hypothetical protein
MFAIACHGSVKGEEMLAGFCVVLAGRIVEPIVSNMSGRELIQLYLS